MYDIIIIGGGPAGLTAAVYARRAGKSALVLEKASFGGQITYSPKIENFPSWGSISGTELADKMMEQALAQGADIELEEAMSVEKTESITVWFREGTYTFYDTDTFDENDKLTGVVANIACPSQVVESMSQRRLLLQQVQSTAF